jgi:hypothetical protein
MKAGRREDYCARCGAPTGGSQLCDRCASRFRHPSSQPVRREGPGLLAHGMTFPQLIQALMLSGELLRRWRDARRGEG